MKELTAEQLIAMTTETYRDAIGTAKGAFLVKVTCHDGVVISNNRLLHWAWGYYAFNRNCNTPISARQIPPSDMIPTAKNHLKYINTAMEIIYTHYKGEMRYVDIATNWLEAYSIQLNFAIRYLEGYTLSIDAEDYVEFLGTDVIKKVKHDLREVCNDPDTTPEQKSHAINDAHEQALDYCTHRGFDDFPNNGLAQHIKGDISKTEQFSQGAIAIGYTAEIDSTLYAVPVLESYAEGMMYNYTYATNMSVCKKAQMYNKDPIEDTEVLHRKSQMIGSQLRHVYVGDCGSKVTFPLKVQRKWVSRLLGVFHVVDDKVEEIGKEDLEGLIGKVIHVRNPCGCLVPHSGAICSVCCGSASESLVDGYNVGHAHNTRFMGSGSQKVLKVKHVELISIGSAPKVNPSLLKYMYLSSDNRELLYGGDSKNVTISFSAQPHKSSNLANAGFLHTVMQSSDVRHTPIANYSTIRTISLDPGDASIDCGIEETEIIKDIKLNLSHDVLEYIKDNPDKLKLYIAKGGRYRYDLCLDKFEFGKSLFVCPFTVFDMLAQHELVKTFISSPGDASHGSVLSDYHTFGEAAERALEITYDKLGINLSLLMVTILPYTVRDLNKRDYRIAKGTNEVNFISQAMLYRERSISIKLPCEKQSEILGKIRLVSSLVREKHAYDTGYL